MTSASDFNLPKTTNSILNLRGQRLHFRYFLPPDLNNTRSIIFFLHGYSGHSSRPEVQRAASILTGSTMATGNRALFCLEFAGHGYSEGVRALIMNHEDLIDDAEQFVRRLMTGATVCDGDDFECGLNTVQWQTIQKIPFYVMGQSMGGGVAVFLAQRLEALAGFYGTILLAPALSTSMPHWIVVALLENTVGSCLPQEEMPSFMNKLSDHRKTWKDDDTIQFADMDTWGKEGALGWNRSMRWGTAIMFVHMMDAFSNEAQKMNSPFLILHDPHEEVVSIEGSRRLLQESKTSDSNKKLVELPNYLHGLLCNHPNEVLKIVTEWMLEQENRRLQSSSTHQV